MNMQVTDSEILYPDDLAALLGCDKGTAQQRIISGDLPGTKFGRDWVIPRQAFIERLNEKAREEAAARRAALATKRDQALTPSPSPMLPTSQPLARTASRRRQPPPLPNLPATASC
jgi:excisionase family DNA binding protein